MTVKIFTCDDCERTSSVRKDFHTYNDGELVLCDGCNDERAYQQECRKYEGRTQTTQEFLSEARKLK